jgi:hypothetical protein
MLVFRAGRVSLAAAESISQTRLESHKTLLRVAQLLINGTLGMRESAHEAKGHIPINNGLRPALTGTEENDGGGGFKSE